MDNFQSLQNKLPLSADAGEPSESLLLCSTPREKNSMNHIDHTTNLYNYYFAPDKVCDIVPTPTHVTRGDLMRNHDKDNLFPLSNISDHKTDRDKYSTHFFPPCSVSVCQKETDTSQECTTQEQSIELPFTNCNQKNSGTIAQKNSFHTKQNNNHSTPSPSGARKVRVNSELPSLTITGCEVVFSDWDEEEEEEEESEDGSNYSSSSTYSSHDTVSKAHSGKKKKKDSNPKRPISGSAVACDREVELEFRKDGSNNRSSSTRSSSTTNKRKNASVKKSRTQTSSNNNNNGKKLGRPKRTSKVGYPKRPLSAYNFYFKDERKRLLQTMPKNKDLMSLSTSQSYQRKGRGPPHHKISFQEMGKKIGNNWKNVGKSMKDKYNLMAKEEKKKYEEKLKEFKKLNPNQMKGSSDNNKKTS